MSAAGSNEVFSYLSSKVIITRVKNRDKETPALCEDGLCLVLSADLDQKSRDESPERGRIGSGFTLHDPDPFTTRSAHRTADVGAAIRLWDY